MADPEVNQGHLGIGFAAEVAPDGTWWITMTHQFGPQAFKWGIPLDMAEDAADQFATALKRTVQQAKRKRSGLVIANGPIPKRGHR
jgi:hypothetical protein